MAVATGSQGQHLLQDGVWEPFQFSTGFAQRHHQNRVEEHARRGKRLHLLQLRRPGEKPQVFSVDTPINEDPSVDELVARLKTRLSLQPRRSSAAHARSISYGGELMLLQREDQSGLQRYHSLAEPTMQATAGMLLSPPNSAGTLRPAAATTPSGKGGLGVPTKHRHGQARGVPLPWDSSSSLAQPTPLPSPSQATAPLPARPRSAFMASPLYQPPVAVRKGTQSVPRMLSPFTGPRSGGGAAPPELAGLAEDGMLMDGFGSAVGPIAQHAAAARMQRLPTGSSLDASLMPASTSISAPSDTHADAVAALKATEPVEAAPAANQQQQGVSQQQGKHRRRWGRHKENDSMINGVADNHQPVPLTQQQEQGQGAKQQAGTGHTGLWDSYDKSGRCAAENGQIGQDVMGAVHTPAVATQLTVQSSHDMPQCNPAADSPTGTVQVLDSPQGRKNRSRRWRWCGLAACFGRGGGKREESTALATDSFFTACEQ